MIPQPAPRAVAPQFKISRGTQLTSPSRTPSVTPPPPLSPRITPAPTPPPPLSPRITPAPTPPPVPPKPAGLTCSNTPSRSSQPKPVPPPKPEHLKLKPKTPSPFRPPRGRTSTPSAGQGSPPAVASPAAMPKTPSLATKMSSSSLECIRSHPVHDAPTSPVAPPRRRRKSADSVADEPIYAVVDFSKKINRRNAAAAAAAADADVAAAATATSSSSERISDMNASSSDVDCISVVHSPDPDWQYVPDDNQQIIENSLAAIADIFGSLQTTDPTAAAVSAASDGPSEAASNATALDSLFGTSSAATAAAVAAVAGAAGACAALDGATIARLVVGGAVVEPSSTIDHHVGVDAQIKEFCAMMENVTKTLPDATVSQDQRRAIERRPCSPAPSTGSVSSVDPCSSRLDAEDLSAGILGDVESSDAARQSSFDDDSDMNRSSAEVSASNDAFGARRRAGFFQSLGAGRRGGIKKKQCVAQSSSTDTDAQDRNRSQLRSHPRQRNSYAAQERLDADADGGPSVKPPERADKPDTGDAVTFGSDSDTDNDKCQRLEGQAKKAFLTAREIYSSERVFVDCLRLICVDFCAAVDAAGAGDRSSSPVLPKAELDRILSYLPHLQNLNQELMADFKMRLRNWNRDPRISDVIVRKGPFLKLYSSYIRDFSGQIALLDECVNKYPRFAKTLREFEAGPRCKNLSLKDYLLKPVQRLPQYRLLLTSYLKELVADPPGVDYHNTITALKVVSEAADHANDSFKNEDMLERMLKLQSRLGNWEIIKPGRFIVKEGHIDKVSRKTLQPRYLILFNDSLLYASYATTSTTSSLKLHQELALERMLVQLPEKPNYEHEFVVISTTRSFALVPTSADERDQWMAALQRTIEVLQEKRLTFFGDRSVAASVETAPARLGQTAPVWTPDNRVTTCQLCSKEFTIAYRRHHCRACGKVVCGSCSSHKAPLEYLKFRSARVCDGCHETIKDDSENDSSACSSMGVDAQPGVEAPFRTQTSTVGVGHQSEHRMPTDPLSHLISQIADVTHIRRQNATRKDHRFIPKRLLEVAADDSQSQMSGYLSQRHKKTWRRNWFVLKGRVLYLYRTPDDAIAQESMPVLGYSIQIGSEDIDGIEKELVFQLEHVAQPPVVFHAETTSLVKQWIDALSTASVL